MNWVDLFDDREKTGLAVFSDHTTAYTHGPEHPLALVLGWGWEGGFWWGKRPLEGTTQISYSLVPHQGLWDEGALGRNIALARIVDSVPARWRAAGELQRSLIRPDAQGVEVPTIQVDGDRALVRLFNAAGPDSEFAISFAMRPSRVEMVELSGKPIRELPVRRASDGRYAVRLAMPRFGIRTLRCELDRMRDG